MVFEVTQEGADSPETMAGVFKHRVQMIWTLYARLSGRGRIGLGDDIGVRFRRGLTVMNVTEGVAEGGGIETSNFLVRVRPRFTETVYH